VGDKVMQIRNNYDKEVFNGDLGIVSGRSTEEQSLEVNFAGRKLIYDLADLIELVLAYAVTVHKSQGSEFPCVIIPIHTIHYPLLQRNLLYTGITRGKKLVVLVGSKKAINIAIRNNRITERYSRLKERLFNRP
jgi:exodeoxyribonuclease V alpha subunit